MPTRIMFIRNRKTGKQETVRVQYDYSQGPPAWVPPPKRDEPKDTSPEKKH